MSFRFWRRVGLAPGVTLNLSKSMASLSFGPPGAKYTISPNGNRATADLTGTVGSGQDGFPCQPEEQSTRLMSCVNFKRIEQLRLTM